jgi:thioredoxin-like negative regulator of GroEL
MDMLQILYFSSAKCSVCHALLPKIQEVVSNVDKFLKVTEIKAAESPEICGKYLIFSFPAVILLYKEKILWQKAGVFPIQEFKYHLNKALVEIND